MKIGVIGPWPVTPLMVRVGFSLLSCWTMELLISLFWREITRLFTSTGFSCFFFFSTVVTEYLYRLDNALQTGLFKQLICKLFLVLNVSWQSSNFKFALVNLLWCILHSAQKVTSFWHDSWVPHSPALDFVNSPNFR